MSVDVTRLAVVIASGAGTAMATVLGFDSVTPASGTLAAALAIAFEFARNPPVVTPAEETAEQLAGGPTPPRQPQATTRSSTVLAPAPRRATASARTQAPVAPATTTPAPTSPVSEPSRRAAPLDPPLFVGVETAPPPTTGSERLDESLAAAELDVPAPQPFDLHQFLTLPEPAATQCRGCGRWNQGLPTEGLVCPACGTERTAHHPRRVVGNPRRVASTPSPSTPSPSTPSPSTSSQPIPNQPGA